jgi:myosin heavy subunit
MRRHRKPPSLVSMWMLDVFCCALGCVTLLWLLNTRLAADERARAASALDDLTATRQSLSEALRTAADKQARLDLEILELKKQVARIDSEKSVLEARVANLNSDLIAKRKDLTAAANRNADLESELRKQGAAAEELQKKLEETAAMRSEAAKLLRDREAEAGALAAKLKTAEESLKSLNEKNATMAKAGDELAAAKAAAKELREKLDESNASIVDLQGEKKKLADKLDRLRIEADARFAGIAMTGKNVVFLIDRSGSMNLLSEQVEAPRKWETVIETATKVMRSLPELENYQIVLFNAEAKYFVESTGWQKYEGEATLAAVKAKLLAVKPEGDTNLYDAFDLAFRLKSQGLDTIYLFSDGLPTTGPAFSKDQEKSLPGNRRVEFLVAQMKSALQAKWNPPGGRKVRINSIGFFYESPEVGAFLWALSRENDGSFVGMSRP